MLAAVGYPPGVSVLFLLSSSRPPNLILTLGCLKSFAKENHKDLTRIAEARVMSDWSWKGAIAMHYGRTRFEQVPLEVVRRIVAESVKPSPSIQPLPKKRSFVKHPRIERRGAKL
jgi:hypothetical protein